MTNLYAELPAHLPDELVQTLFSAVHLRIERIVSQGHASPPEFWFDQAEHEWVLLMQGAARLRFDDELVELKPGDFLNILAHRRHRVEWTATDQQTIWLAIYYE
ncbi:MAG: cupin domain-containing protein [Pirellulaceae bacterium]|nr:cupin domain-containing protein [Pirellulaceae bacterium]